MRSRKNRSGFLVDFVKYTATQVLIKIWSLFPWVNEQNFDVLCYMMKKQD